MNILNHIFIVKYIKNKINQKFLEVNKKIDENTKILKNDIVYLTNENIELRIKYKKVVNQKLNVLFVCHRPALWGSLKTVYQAMKNDDAFSVKIITIPNKKQLPDLGLVHEIYESEGAEEFWKGEDVISGYNYETKEWLDLKTLKPDYIFFQQPYNIQRCPSYKSWEVSKYAKIGYVEYGYHTNQGMALDCLPADFVKNVSLFFLQNQTEKEWYNKYFNEIDNTFTKMFITGFPRFDFLEKYKGVESKCWKNKHDNRFRIIWTPRWTTNENNCNFFNYKDNFFEYCKKNESTTDFIFRPHPQAFLNWIEEKKLTEEDITELSKIYDNSKNMSIDKTKEYLTTFYSSDCLISDYSSVVPEYFLTGKPVIYCKNDKSVFDIEGNITKGFYIVHNWEELNQTLNDLQNGIDPLKAVREELIKTEFLMSEKPAGYEIADIIKNDVSL